MKFEELIKFEREEAAEEAEKKAAQEAKRADEEAQKAKKEAEKAIKEAKRADTAEALLAKYVERFGLLTA